MAQIPSHGPHRNLHPEALRQQQLHGFAGPQGEGQLELVGTPIANPAAYLSGLHRRQPRLRRSPPMARSKAAATLLPIGLHPPMDGLPRDPKEAGRLGLAHLLLDYSCNYPSAQVFLGGGRQRASIALGHTPRYSSHHHLSTIMCSD
jgi:hypothetical protein